MDIYCWHCLVMNIASIACTILLALYVHIALWYEHDTYEMCCVIAESRKIIRKTSEKKKVQKTSNQITKEQRTVAWCAYNHTAALKHSPPHTTWPFHVYLLFESPRKMFVIPLNPDKSSRPIVLCTENYALYSQNFNLMLLFLLLLFSLLSLNFSPLAAGSVRSISLVSPIYLFLDGLTVGGYFNAATQQWHNWPLVAFMFKLFVMCGYRRPIVWVTDKHKTELNCNLEVISCNFYFSNHVRVFLWKKTC